MEWLRFLDRLNRPELPTAREVAAKMKPRIKIFKTWTVTWICENEYAKAYGHNPTQAYTNWQIAMSRKMIRISSND